MTRAKLGQNFLTDPNWQKRIVDLFKPVGAFGEIGPGRGALTDHLRRKFPSFVVFEMDEELCRFHEGKSGVEVIRGDFCNWNFRLHGNPVENFSFIGNLPYESGTAIVKSVCLHASQVHSFLFLLQKEVVDRICAVPKTRNMGSLSILVQGQFDLAALDQIGPQAFRPMPKVQSQLVRGVRRQNPHPLEDGYLKFIQSAFLHKRKTFKNALKSRLSSKQIDALLERWGFSSTVRSEEIEVDRWRAIYRDVQNER